MIEFDRVVGTISGVHVEEILLSEPFVEFAARFADQTGTVVLMSGTDLDCARYHILGIKPWLTLRAARNGLTLDVTGQRHQLAGNPFDWLQALVKHLHVSLPTVDQPWPVAAGFLGYLSYDLKDILEVLPRTTIDDTELPQLFLVAPAVLVIHDKKLGITRLCIPERVDAGEGFSVPELTAAVRQQLDSPGAEKPFRGDMDRARAGFTRDSYMAAVETIKEYIAAGHVYQVNLSQRFEVDFEGNAYRLFEALYAMNPAPFFAYVHAGDHQIVSTSPERFVQQMDRLVETRPIKGTRPRGRTPEADEGFRNELLASRKDDAELSMIVDLLRNDMGKVCCAESVRVTEHKRLESYQNVYHLVSVVQGTLPPEKDAVDLIRATFPGGSITGCPKIRAMEIIDELEPCRRHIYTGSIGYISFHDTMDLSIAIRTATIVNGKMLFSVGGGIVYDSDPSDEYEETLHKGQSLMTVLKSREKPSAARPVAWCNGIFRPLTDTRIPVTDLGLQYGFGFFETIRAVNGEPRRLADHLARFEHTWQALFQSPPPDLTWSDIIGQVLHRNGLNQATAAVKILATRGERTRPPHDHQLLVTARPYTHRLAGKTETGLHLAIYPEARLTPLADHKTLNYLYYLLAGQWAVARGADEAVIVNPDGSVSETNTAGILAVTGQTVIRPVSAHVLPSVMQKTVCERLADWGYRVEEKRLMPPDLLAAEQVLVVNALMGAVPVLSIDGQAIAGRSGDLYPRINRDVL